MDTRKQPVERLIYSRKDTAEALGGISIATVIRWENSGKLEKLRPAGSPNGKVFHRAEQVHALAAARPEKDKPAPQGFPPTPPVNDKPTP